VARRSRHRDARTPEQTHQQASGFRARKNNQHTHRARSHPKSSCAFAARGGCGDCAAPCFQGQCRSGERRLSRLLDLALSELSKLAGAPEATRRCERALRNIKADSFVRGIMSA